MLKYTKSGSAAERPGTVPKKRERSVERAGDRRVKALGGIGKKQNGWGYNSYPDKMYMKPGVSKVLWVEYKRDEKQKPTPGQLEVHKLLRKYGQTVIVTHDPDIVAEAFQRLCD